MRDHGPTGRDPSSTEEWPNSEDLSRFESRWRSGDRGSIERSLSETDPPRASGVLSLLIAAEIRLRREAGERPTPEEYLARFPGHAALIEAAFASQGETWVREGSEDGRGSTEGYRGSEGRFPTVIERDATEETGGGPPRDGDGKAYSSKSKEECRYRIVSRHEGGGLGEIFLAEDLELHRTVALKEIRESLAADSQARARFLLEAEVIGKLEHPGIVPIYGKGHHRDGRPYYAMRFIDGESLREAIDRFHAGRADRPRFEHDLEFRGLLGRLVDVCNAIEYAHSRGVVHRDIKPRNVMLGRFGETLVVDWGLAKILGVDRDVDAADFPFRAPAADEVDPTRMDKALGTLRYMSPEQAAGRVDRIGPATDIFSLGSTLYCLLTGGPPYNGPGPEEVRERAIRRDFIPPRKVRPEVPAPLESICLKAMERDPDARYHSARALADDVERWLADEPVSAHKDRAAARASRWVRRHRPQVAAAVALLLTLTAALAVGIVLIRAEQQKTEAAKKKIDEALILADSNLDTAGEAIETILYRLSQDKMAYVPGMTEVRTELVDNAAGFFKRLIKQRPDDRKLRRKYADTCSMAANNHRVAGRMGRFFEYYDEVFSEFRSLIADDPTDLKPVNALVWAELAKGDALAQTGQIKPAYGLFQQALAKAERVLATDLGSMDYQYTLARAQLYMGDFNVMIGEFGKGGVLLDLAIERLTPLLEAHPEYEVFFRHLIYMHCLRGVVAAAMDDPSLAGREFDKSLALLDEWLRRPDASKDENDYNRAIVLNEQGWWMNSSRRQTGESERAHDEAERLMARLCHDFPSLPDYLTEHGLALLNRGLARREQTAEKRSFSRADLQQAAERLGAVVKEHPDNIKARGALGRSLGALGRFSLEDDDRASAIRLLEQAVVEQERCLEKNMASPLDRKALREHRDLLGRAVAGQ